MCVFCMLVCVFVHVHFVCMYVCLYVCVCVALGVVSSTPIDKHAYFVLAAVTVCATAP